MSNGKSHSTGGRSSDSQASPSKKGIKIPPFYSDEGTKKIDPRLFSEEADRLAKELCKNNNKNKRSQIRKFYDEVLEHKNRMDSEKSFSDFLPYFKMLNAKAAYAKARDLVDDNFAAFIKECIGQVKDKKDLEVFASLFEAVMGFARQYNKQN